MESRLNPIIDSLPIIKNVTISSAPAEIKGTEKSVIKFVFNASDLTIGALEIYRDDYSIVVLKLTFEYLPNKKVDAISLYEVINKFNMSCPLIKAMKIDGESKKITIGFTQEHLIITPEESKRILENTLKVFTAAPQLFSNELKNKKIIHRSIFSE